MARLGQDPQLAFIGNLVESFYRAKALRFQEDLSLRREDRYETQLQENRLHRQRRLSISREHLGLAKGREARLADQPRVNTVEYYTSRGYPPEQAKRLLDIKLGAKQRPLDTLMKGLAMREEAYSDIEYEAAEEIIRESIAAVAAQREGVSAPIFEGDESTAIPETGVFQRTQQSKPAVTGGFLGRKEPAFPAGFETPEGLESIWGQLSDEEKTTARTYIEGGGTPQKIIELFEPNRQLQ